VPQRRADPNPAFELSSWRGARGVRFGRPGCPGELMGGAGDIASGWSGFGRWPARLGVEHGQGAVRLPGNSGRLAPARNWSEWPPVLARRGAPAGEVAKAAEAGRPSHRASATSRPSMNVGGIGSSGLASGYCSAWTSAGCIAGRCRVVRLRAVGLLPDSFGSPSGFCGASGPAAGAVAETWSVGGLRPPRRAARRGGPP
jgi:hypothetical protein